LSTLLFDNFLLAILKGKNFFYSIKNFIVLPADSNGGDEGKNLKKCYLLLLLNITSDNTDTFRNFEFFVAKLQKGQIIINLPFCVIVTIGRRKKLREIFLLRNFLLSLLSARRRNFFDAIFQLLRGESFLIEFLGIQTL
jgi:hypothetical protein